MAKIVPVADTDYARQKADLAARAVKAEVTGDLPIRDSVTRESMYRGQTVSIDPQTANIDHLVRSGAVRLLTKADSEG